MSLRGLLPWQNSLYTPEQRQREADRNERIPFYSTFGDQLPAAPFEISNANAHDRQRSIPSPTAAYLELERARKHKLFRDLNINARTAAENLGREYTWGGDMTQGVYNEARRMRYEALYPNLFSWQNAPFQNNRDLSRRYNPNFDYNDFYARGGRLVSQVDETNMRRGLTRGGRSREDGTLPGDDVWRRRWGLEPRTQDGASSAPGAAGANPAPGAFGLQRAAPPPPSNNNPFADVSDPRRRRDMIANSRG